jgi:hypothetical protein
MTDTVDIQKILSRLSPQQQSELKKLAADPTGAAALTAEIQRSIAERQADIERQKAEIERAAGEKRAADAAIVETISTVFGELAKALDAVSERIDRIQQSDAQRLVLAAANYAAWRNGHLRFDNQKFKTALAGGKNDAS